MGQRLKFLVDEDVPRSTARILREAGYDAVDVRDAGLRGQPDRSVFEFAQKEQRILISCDLGFANIIQYPPAGTAGIVVVRIPDEIPIPQFNRILLKSIQGVGERLVAHLAVIEVDKVRLRGA